MMAARTWLWAMLIAQAVCVSLCFDAWAHKVNVFAYVEGKSIRVEGYFGGSAKAKGCRVEVFDGAGNKLLEGKTDDRGICLFSLRDLTAQGGLRFVLHAGSGHWADFTMDAKEIHAVPSEKPAPGEVGERPDGQAAKARTSADPADSGANTGAVTPVDGVALKRDLEEVLDRRMRPLETMLGNQHKILLEQERKGPSVSDIVGGIGWIMGIVGVTAYFMSLRRIRK